MIYRFKTFTVKGKDRNINSDYVKIKELPTGFIGVVCDGVGDQTEIENSGRICAEMLIEFIEKSNEPDPLKKMKLAIERANKYLHSIKQKEQNEKVVTTTLVILYLLNHSACWAHVGDSRIYKMKNGRLNLLTKDHSVIQELVDGGFLTLKEASFHSGINVIGRAIGEKPEVAADISKINLQPTDINRFFLCTDGLTNILSDAEIESCLKKDDLNECSESLIYCINKDEIADDTSFVIVEANRIN